MKKKQDPTVSRIDSPPQLHYYTPLTMCDFDAKNEREQNLSHLNLPNQ